jgi:small-conductance mechanosensitive channel
MQYVEKLLRDLLFNPSTLVGGLVYLAIVLVCAWGVARLLSLLILRWPRGEGRGQVGPAGTTYLIQLSRVLVYVLALILYAHLIPPLRALGTALLAGVSVASIVIGIAAQNTLGNLISGFSILAYRPFNIGDLIQVTAPTGLERAVVENITLGYTVLSTDDRRRIVVPNTVIANQVTINLSDWKPAEVLELTVPVRSGGNIERARAILLAAASRHPAVQETLACRVTHLTGLSATLSLEVRCTSQDQKKQLASDVYQQASIELEREGLLPMAPAH